MRKKLGAFGKIKRIWVGNIGRPFFVGKILVGFAKKVGLFFIFFGWSYLFSLSSIITYIFSLADYHFVLFGEIFLEKMKIFNKKKKKSLQTKEKTFEQK